MEARISENQIVVPIGTAITFKMIAKNQQKIDLKVIESEENSKFFVLFDENDVDFEIEINNSKCIHGIGYTLVVNNGFYDYYIGAGERWLMETLYTKGRKLHFTSENSEKGQNIIQETAQNYDITYSESAAVCSRIEFKFEVESKPQFKAQNPSEANLRLPSFGSLSAPRPFSLGRDVPDSNAVLSSESTQQSNNFESVLNGINSVQHSLSAVPRNTNNGGLLFGSSLASQWKPDRKDPKQKKNSKPEVGDKGVVCFGEQSNQFYNTYNGFTKDKNLEIKPFVVELRFSK